MPFKSLGLSDNLINKLSQNNYKKPYPIQEQAIPHILNNKDIMGIAKTGSGKTAAYILPVIQKLEDSELEKSRNINTLILVPTRELAMQVKEVFDAFNTSSNNIKAMAVYGGVSINPQMKGMYGTNLLIATPGRLIELIENNALSVSSLKTLVIDEADKMLELGFKEEIDKIFTLLPKKRQNMLFSATLSDKIEDINNIILNYPIVIKIEEDSQELEHIEQLAYYVTDEKKGPLLRHLIKTENMTQVLIFVASGYKCDNISFKLSKHGIEARAIHGKKSQGARNAALEDFKAGRIQALVSTDLLARGIDIELLPHIINFDLPRSPKDYIHRIGRTGRANNTGKAISFVSPEDEHHFKIIQKKAGKPVPRIYEENIKELNK
ncbi:MAG: DEAD/DEAH box helicase [Flavobacteriaceae bacterium]|nr:DEAD/DEAH box helicase [Flavobacteriaceae bacterium]